MKIAIDCRMIGSGGIGTYISELIPRFVKNHSCVLIGNEKNLAIYKDSPNTQIAICEITPFSLTEMFFFPREILEKINSCDAYYTPYCNIPNGIKIPIFSTIHDVVFLDVQGLSSSMGTFARKIIYQRAINKSKVMFTVSKFSENRIRQNLNCKKNIIVTYNACPSWLKNDNKNADTASENDGYILFVGNIKKHKGLHTLLEAFSEARKKGLKQRLVIVGNAENFRTGDDTIKAKIDAMPENSVRFTGKISDEELKTLYEKAILLVQPSLYEGFGLPPLEALTLGTNALISDIEVFKEIYEHFPVHFFKTENAQDLAEKIIECVDLPAPTKIPEIYSFDRTYGIINAGLAFNNA